MMLEKNMFLLLALSGSVLMVMLVSTLLFIPQTTSLQANVTGDMSKNSAPLYSGDKFYEGREPDQILKIIQEYVQDNDPETAKQLYEELSNVRQHRDIDVLPMGGEVSGEVVAGLSGE